MGPILAEVWLGLLPGYGAALSTGASRIPSISFQSPPNFNGSRLQSRVRVLDPRLMLPESQPPQQHDCAPQRPGNLQKRWTRCCPSTCHSTATRRSSQPGGMATTTAYIHCMHAPSTTRSPADFSSLDRTTPPLHLYKFASCRVTLVRTEP